MPTPEFEIDNTILDGYPSIISIHKNFSSTQSPPYPNLFMQIDNQYLTGYPSFRKSFANPQDIPYPKMMFNIDSSYINSYPSLRMNFSPAQSSPLPRLLIGCNNNYVNGYPAFERNFGWMNTCRNDTNITSINIPSNVQRIADYTFRTTSLTSVTLGQNTIYYPHSFPANCVVTGGILKDF